MYYSPPGRSDPLSIVDLIELGNINAEMAGILWLAMEHRASVLTAAVPRLAGKSTTIQALMALTPPNTGVQQLRGRYETFAFLEKDPEPKPYLYANEISEHMPMYLWGSGVRNLFESSAKGYPIVSTMHADSLEEVWDTLTSPPCSVPPNLLNNLNLVIILRIFRMNNRRDLLHRVVEVHELGSFEISDEAPHSHLIYVWQPSSDTFYVDRPFGILSGIAQNSGLTIAKLEREATLRSEILRTMGIKGIREYHQVRDWVERYYSEPAEVIAHLGLKS